MKIVGVLLIAGAAYIWAMMGSTPLGYNKAGIFIVIFATLLGISLLVPKKN